MAPKRVLVLVVKVLREAIPPEDTSKVGILREVMPVLQLRLNDRPEYVMSYLMWAQEEARGF